MAQMRDPNADVIAKCDMVIWDRGTHRIRAGQVIPEKFVLHGRRINAFYDLQQQQRRKGWVTRAERHIQTWGDGLPRT